MKLRNTTCGWALAAALALTTGLQANEHDKQKAYTDTGFVECAMQGNMAKIRVGEIAQQKGQSAEVKQFGEKLVTDHRRANDELKSIANKQGISAQSALDEKHQKSVSKLQAASGAEFDKEFAKCMVKGHKRAVSEYERASQQAQDPQVKAFAQKSLPKIREHLQASQTLARSVGLDEATISAIGTESDDEAAGTAGGATESGKGEAKNTDKDASKKDPYPRKENP